MSNYLGCIGHIVVRCRACDGPATVSSSFRFYGWKEAKELPTEVRDLAHRWGGWLVVENYPSVAKWVAPEKNEVRLHNGDMVRCTMCHHQEARDIRWPDDAYYRWEIRGNTLWACNLEHARALLDFIGSKERDENRYPGYEKSLRKLPTEFISAKVRDDVVKAISRTLRDDRRPTTDDRSS